MATYIKTVDPNGGTDPDTGDPIDYTSLSAWEAGEQSLYLSADYAVADCLRQGSTRDTATCTIDGFVSMPQIIVRPAYRHEGVVADTRSGGNYVYTLAASAENIYCFRSNTLIEGLAISAASSENIVFIRNAGDCIVRDVLVNGQNAGGRCFTSFNHGGTNRFENCIGYNADRGLTRDFASGVAAVYNCTFYNCATAGVVNTVTSGVDARNTVTYACGTDWLLSSGSWAASCTNNASEDGTHPGSNGLTLAANPFTDAAGGDFSLASGSALIDAGADLSGTFTDDIVGTTRSEGAAWDIGAFEYASGGGTPDPTDIAFTGTAPVPTLVAAVAHDPPEFAASFAGTAPLPDLAAAVGHAPPEFEASFSATAPLASLAATVGHSAPEFEASFAGTVPLPTLEAVVGHAPPEYEATFEATAPLPQLAAEVDFVAPGSNVGFAATAPLPTLTAEVERTVPDFPASFSATAPLPTLAVVVSVVPPGLNVSFTGAAPLAELAASVTRTLPGRSIGFTATAPMPTLAAVVGRTVPEFGVGFAGAAPLPVLSAGLFYGDYEIAVPIQITRTLYFTRELELPLRFTREISRTLRF